MFSSVKIHSVCGLPLHSAVPMRASSSNRASLNEMATVDVLVFGGRCRGGEEAGLAPEPALFDVSRQQASETWTVHFLM